MVGGDALRSGAARKQVLPKKPGRPPNGEKAKGDPLTFRADADVEAYLDRARASGFSKTSVMNRSVRLMRDASDGLDDLWWEIERLAKVEGTTEGAVVARLVRLALESESTRKPKK